MTVAELIAVLQQYPPDTRVLVDGYEGGLTDPDSLYRLSGVQTQVDPTYFGKYQTTSDYSDPAPVPTFDAVVIPRGSI